MRHALRWLSVFAFLAANVTSTFAAEGKYNVLMLCVDDMRPSLGCYGDTLAITPNIDRLAAGGTLFLRSYCQQAVCSPSRTSLLTGRRPDTTRVYDLQTHFRKFLPDIVTLPQQFKNHGYFTQSFSKVFHGGFDDPISWSVKSWNPNRSSYQKPETLAILESERRRLEAANVVRSERVLERDPATGLVLKTSAKGERVRGPAWEDPDVADDELSDGATADEAIAVLNRVKDQRFFLAVGFLKPHLPFVAPANYFAMHPRDKFKPADNPYPPTDMPAVAATSFGELRAYHGMPKKGPVSDEQAVDLIRAYYAATSYADAQIGRVLDELKRLELDKNTVVVLWGDHGWQLGEHGQWCKHTNFELATRTMLIFRVPGQEHAGAKSEALAEFVDIYPTLCELCELPLSDGLEGTSLAPVIARPDRAWKEAAFSQYPRTDDNQPVMGHSLRTDRYRYTEWRRADDKLVGVELYDHETDPGENTNVASRDENQTLVASLSAQLKAGWRAARP